MLLWFLRPQEAAISALPASSGSTKLNKFTISTWLNDLEAQLVKSQLSLCHFLVEKPMYTRTVMYSVSLYFFEALFLVHSQIQITVIINLSALEQCHILLYLNINK
jgi:hypothetical protein